MKYLSTGSIADQWGSGNFMVLKFDWGEGADKVLVGMNPSQGSGMVDITDDPDKNGVFKVTDKNNQSFKVKVFKGENVTEYTYTLGKLVCESNPGNGVG